MITENLRDLHQDTAAHRHRSIGPKAQHPLARRSVSQRIVLVLAAAGGMVAAGAFGEVGRAIATAAPDLLLAMKDAIVAAAQGWGQPFLNWVKDMLIRISIP